MNEAAPVDDLGTAAVLGRVADDFTRRLNAGERPDVEDYARRHPELASVLRQVLPALQAISPSAPNTGLPNDLFGPPGNGLGVLGDYRIVREVGRGGMGVVYEAEQVSLGRRVALKVLPFAAAADERHLRRFRAEAQAAAQLHHQHIVPVYGVGCERGVYFYAMQFVDGRTLADVVRELRADRPAHRREPPPADDPDRTGPYAQPNPGGPAVDVNTQPDGGRSTERSGRGVGRFRAMAELVAQAAEALEHAHQIGVVHRDVKPANLMVDARGHLWVTDFGLARLHSDAGLTVSGDLLGTLRYMSPEQALGRHGLVDHRTDVYSLGATFYELLTLEPAFGGTDRQEVLRQVTSEEPRPPRKSDPGIPADLETIALKAMAKSPIERYATAQELADDLRRFLGDHTIRARRPTAVQRVRKWARRHKAAVTAAALAGVTALAAGAAVAVVQRNEAVRQRDQAKSQWERAEAKTRMARQVVDTMLTGVGKQLVDSPQMQQVARDFLAEAQRYYQEFLDENDTDPAMRRETGQAYFRMADIYWQLGQFAAARGTFDRAAALQESLCAEFPGEPLYRSDLGQTLSSLGGVLRGLHKIDEAERAHERSVALCSSAAADAPTEPRFRECLAISYANLAELRRATGRVGDARDAYQRAADLLERLAADAPGVADYRSHLAHVRTDLGQILLDSGRLEEAEQTVAKAVETLEQVAGAQPDAPRRRVELADACLRLGTIQNIRENSQAAERSYRRAMSHYEKLVADYPAVPAYRSFLANSHNNLGLALAAAKRFDAAEQEYQRARSLGEKLAAEHPEVPGYRTTIASAHNNSCVVFHAQGRLKEAIESARQALAARERLAAEHPAVSKYRVDRASAVYNLAKLLGEAKQFAEAERTCRQAQDQLGQLVAEFPDEPKHREFLAHSHVSLAFVLDQTGRAPEADREHEEALRIKEALVATFPGTARYRKWLVLGYDDHAQRLTQAGRAREAIPFERKAKGVLTKLTADVPGEIEYRDFLAGCTFNLAYMLEEVRERGEAVAEMRHSQDLYRRLAAEAPAVPKYRYQLILACGQIGLWLKDSDPGASEAAYRESLALGEKLVAESPDSADYRIAFAGAKHNLAIPAAKAGRYAESARLRREGNALYEAVVAAFPDAPGYRHSLAGGRNGLAWFLATCPDPQHRDARQAVMLAQQATKDMPQRGGYWNTLGVARYYAGDWQDAVAALDKATELKKGGDPNDWLFLAMAHHRLGRKDEAQRWYDRSAAWIADRKTQDAELLRFHTEAKELLGR